MIALALFLGQVIAVSLSGVMAPGAVTTATLAQGARRPHAGALIALGHGVVEFPLMLIIAAGLGAVFETPAAQIAIGLLGGGVLAWMGLTMLRDARRPPALDTDQPRARGPFLQGILLTAANPYFLLWWASVGMALALDARKLGPFAFILFALVHWTCDLIWLEFLSFASHRGSRVFGPRSTRAILLVCSLAMLVFAARFIYDALASL